jgi:hypothetical protein
MGLPGDGASLPRRQVYCALRARGPVPEYGLDEQGSASRTSATIRAQLSA